MCAVEEGLLELDEEVRDGFTLRHLLSHCSGLRAESAATRRRAWSTRRAPTAATRTPATRSPARLVERAAEMPFGEYLRAAVLDPLGMDASLGLDPADGGSRRGRARARTLGGWRAVLQQRRRSVRPRSPRAAASRPLGGTPAFSRACSTAAVRTGAGCSRAETVDEMLSTQFGELPGTVEALATWDACPWGLGLDVRGTREPHWTGDALTATANTHFGSSGTLAWIDRERGLGLVALASRSSYSGWWSRAGGWADLSAAVVASATARPSARSGWRRPPRSRPP